MLVNNRLVNIYKALEFTKDILKTYILFDHQSKCGVGRKVSVTLTTFFFK